MQDNNNSTTPPNNNSTAPSNNNITSLLMLQRQQQLHCTTLRRHDRHYNRSQRGSIERKRKGNKGVQFTTAETFSLAHSRVLSLTHARTHTHTHTHTPDQIPSASSAPTSHTRIPYIHVEHSQVFSKLLHRLRERPPPPPAPPPPPPPLLPHGARPRPPPSN